MEKRLIKALAICAAVSPLAAFAGTMGDNVNAQQGHFYGELGLGYNNFDVNTNDVPASSWSKYDASFTARGGYELPFNDGLHFGVEGGYLYLGKMTFKGVEGTKFDLNAKQQGADLLVTASKDLNPNFGLFAKGGIAYVKQSYSLNSQNVKVTGFSEDDHAVVPELAAGVKYNINEKLAVTGTVTHLFSHKDVVASTGVGVGLRMTF